MWLQVVAVSLGALMAWKPSSWLEWPCKTLPDVGICECRGGADEQTCYGNQLIYRTEAAALLVFCFLLILCVSGCARHAAKSFPVGKFLVLLLLILVLLFMPNDVLSAFGAAAGVASSVYLVAQTVLLMDFAYSWNETWFTKSQTQQRNLDPRGAKMWQVAILVSAAAFLIASIVGVAVLCTTFYLWSARALVILTFVASLMLLVVSILDWCEHGALLTSAVVMAYLMWLCYEALSMLPSDNFNGHLLPRWVGLLICAISLAAFAYSASFSGREPALPAPAGLAEQGQGPGAAVVAAQDQEADEDVPEGLDVSDFTVQCVVHATAAVYITSALAPSRSSVTFGARVAAVALSVLLYGWTLVAPKVLKNRQF